MLYAIRKGIEMIRIAICDDNKETLVQNEMLIKKYLKELNVLASIDTYLSGEFLQFDVQENKFFDLLLLDIEMPRKSGMDIGFLIVNESKDGYDERDTDSTPDECMVIGIETTAEYP